MLECENIGDYMGMLIMRNYGVKKRVTFAVPEVGYITYQLSDHLIVTPSDNQVSILWLMVVWTAVLL